MAGLVNVDLAGASDLVKSVGGLAGQIRSAITGDLSPEAKATLEQAALAAEQAADQAQAATNTEEAKSTSFFRSGWRPAVGWLCVVALAYNYLGAPLLRLTIGTAPVVDMAELYPLLFGILGIGTMRTVEKIQGIQ